VGRRKKEINMFSFRKEAGIPSRFFVRDWKGWHGKNKGSCSSS
jgi:hypothetical protein